MIQRSTFPLVFALQGGACMSSVVPSHSSSHERQVVPSQVWAALSSDLRTHTIGLLAQLALNLIIARSNTEPYGKESRHACSPEHPKNPC
jgi:hypothetical protein